MAVFCVLEAHYFSVYYISNTRVSQWQGMTKRLGTKRGVLGDAGRQREQGIEWL